MTVMPETPSACAVSSTVAPAKRAQRGDPGLSCVLPLQPREGIIQIDEARHAGIRDIQRLRQRDPIHVPAALPGTAPPCVVHQDVAHHLRRHGEEVTPVTPAHAALPLETQPGLIDERRRLQRVIGALSAKGAPGHPPQLRLHEGKKRIECDAIALAPAFEVCGYLRVRDGGRTRTWMGRFYSRW